MTKGFRKVLHERLLDQRLTYEDLSRKIGVSGVYVGKIMQGKVVPSDEVIYKLSQALDLDLDHLVLLAHLEKAPEKVKPVFARLSQRGALLSAVDSYDNVEPDDLGPGRTIPVVGMVQAGEFSLAEDGDFPPGVADGYVYSDRKGRNLFAVRVTNDSMEPGFREGDMLVINPNLEARSGDYVIAKIKDENEATFKKLMIHQREQGHELIILRPLNPQYQDIVISDPSTVEIIGKVVERKTLF